MSESMLRRILRDHQARRRSIALILCLSMVVSLGVFSGLRKDAVAKTYTRVVLECPYMADDAAQVVHTHNDDCFDEVGNLVCTLPELEAHTHGDECYTEVRTLVCGLEENPGHRHTDDCYTAETTLICALEENEGHQHTGDCYTLERGELLCDNTDEDHEHTDECYQWNEVLSCGMEAGEGAHVHSEDCYRTDWILTCGMEAGEGAHTHTDECYLTDRVLTCDKPEIILHTHTDDCYQKNDDGSIYVDEGGYSWLICGQQEIIEHVHDADCFKVYELDDGEPEETAAGEEIITADETAGEQAEAEGTNETEPTITEAENTDEAEDTEEKTDSKDTAELNENEENKEETKDETKEETESTDTESDVPAVPMPAQSFEKTAGGIRVSVEAPEGAFPENTRMSVRPVNGSGLVDTVSDAVNGEILEVQAVDITFYDADDNEIEPATAIRVSIVPANSQYSEEKANVVHIDSEGAATAVEQAEGTTEDNSEVVFDADSFSIYAIVYTVHFEYEVDGQVYTSSVPGAQDKLLSELIRELNVVAEVQLGDFMAKIAEVGISNPEVLKITEVEGDWTIRPLKDSEQEEALTIVMQDGATFRITVETEGVTEVRTEDETAVIRTVNDLYLPQDATAVAQTLTEEESGSAIAAVQQAAAPDGEEVLENADDAAAAVDAVDTADTGTNYHAFSIGLENVDVEAYDGFNVNLILPEDAVVGRDFQLYQVKEDGTAADITESLAVTSQTTEDGLQAVSELSFTTDSFAEYVLSYSIETYYTTYEGDSLKISLNYGPKAGIPEGAELKVSEILPEDERYSDYLNDSVTELGVKSGAVAFARFLDIEIQKDGEKIEPLAPVSVKIQMMDLPEETGNAEAQVIHFGEQTEVLAAEAVGTDVSFETGSFSVYGVLYTVDFEYSVNGKMYQFSLPGGGFVSFTNLVEVLGIIGDTNSEENGDENGAVITENSEENAANEAIEEDGLDSDTNTTLTLGDVEVSEATRKFVADVASVVFSSPELVDISKVEGNTTVGQIKESRGLEVEYSTVLTEEQIAEINAQTVEAGDWALISIHPFVTEETLTITMKNGEIFQITVTDDQENPYGLDGKAFAITAYKKSNNTYYYITSDSTGISSSNPNCLKAYNYNPSSGETPQGSAYTFEWTGEGKKYLIHDNQNRYIVIENDKISLTDKDTALANPITVISRDGKYSFVNEENNHALNIFGNSGFGSWTYDAGNSDFLMTLQDPSNLKQPGTIATADTSGVLQINMFDYGPENELDKETYNNSNPYSGGINSGHTLKFFSYGKNVGTGINDFSGSGNGPITGIVADQLPENNPYPVVASNPTESLDYLFGGTSNSNVTPHTGLNYLFTKDENGYYHYNSDQNYAYLNGSNFEVYSKTFPEEGADEQYFGVGFFPFNPYNEYYNCIHGKDGFSGWSPHSGGTDKNGHYNHHFGMSLAGNFIMPPDGQYNGNDVTFEFSGDDDLWVFVDGVLIMDIGGIHNPVSGEINFTTGEVTVHGAAQENFKEKYKRITGKDWDDSDFSNHDFRVFYMERGGMYSNLEVTFNLPLTPETQTNNFQFDKVSTEEEDLKLSGAEFALFTDQPCTQPFTLASVPVTASSDDNGVVSFKNVPYGTYYMKETAYPQGYQAKDPEEIFTVVVDANGGAITSSSGGTVTQVTNQPKNTDVEVEKVWVNGSAPAGAQVEVVLGRYKLIEDPNAPGTATLVIKDSYTGLPSGSAYHVTYTITGPDGYSQTITRSYTESSKNIEESVEVPAAVAGTQYTVTKQVQNISYHNIANQNQTVNATVAKNGTGQAQFNQSTFTRNAYRVRIYAVNKQDQNNLESYSEAYYPAGSRLSLRIEHNAYNWGFFSFTASSNTGWNSGTYSSDSEKRFTDNLNQDIDLYVRCSNSDWTKGFDWIKAPYITGASPVQAVSASRMMVSMRLGTPMLTAVQSLSQTASAPTLPDPPQNTLYTLDEDYAADPDTITLSGSTWTGKLEDLPAWNEYGPYVYYIASVSETGMPDGTTIAIADEVTLDGSENVLTVTNTLPEPGSLKITKKVTVDGTDASQLAAPKKSLADGTYSFKVYESDGVTEAKKADGTDVGTITVQISDGAASTAEVTGLFPGEYVVKEISGDNANVTLDPDGHTVTVVSGQSGSSVAAGGIALITNAYTSTGITVQKQWQKADGTADNSKTGNITVTLLQTAYVYNADAESWVELDNTVAAYTGAYTLKIGNGAEEQKTNASAITFSSSQQVTVSNLPQNGKLEDGTPVRYQYSVRESEVIGYTGIETEDGSGNWTVVNRPAAATDQDTTLVVQKLWKTSDGQTATLKGDETIEFVLKQKAVKTDYIPVTISLYNPGETSAAASKTIYVKKGTTFFYHVDDYTVSPLTTHYVNISVNGARATRHSNGSRLSVNNVTAPVEIIATIRGGFSWSALSSWASNPWTHDNTDLYIWTFDYSDTKDYKDTLDDLLAAYSGEQSGDGVADNTYRYEMTVNNASALTDAVGNVTVSNFTANFTELPLFKQVGSDFYTYWYTIEEIKVNGETVVNNQTEDYLVAYDTSTAGTTKITNTEKEKVTVDAVKAWSNADGTTTPPEGATVVFELYRDGEATGKIVTLNGKIDVATQSEVTNTQTYELNADALTAKAYESEAWKALWTDLVKYKEDGETEYVYTVREVTGYPGYSASPDSVSSGETITNTEITTSLNIVKTDVNDSSIKLADAQFTIRPINSTLGANDVSYAGDESEPVTTNANGEAQFEGLTYGYYEIREKLPPKGYVLDGDACFYIRVDADGVKLLQKDLTKDPKDWTANTTVGNVTLNVTTNTATAIVGNTPGIALPNTGGPGTRLFTILGSILTLGAGVLLWRRRRLI